MPELPEVETIRRDLSRVLLGKRIKRVEVRKIKLVRGPVEKFKRELKGNSFDQISRRGKLLIFELLPARGERRYLLIHLKMTGQLIYDLGKKLIAGGHRLPKDKDNFDLPNKYTHVIFYLADRSVLYYNDLRQFGFMKLVGEEGRREEERKYGLDPLVDKFDFDNFAVAIKKSKSTVKQALMNQQNIAGIGNIYADEICFQARIRPNVKISRLGDNKLHQLFQACEHIIRQAIKHRGTTFSDYRDAQGGKGGYIKYLKVYGRVGEKCLRCRRADAIIRKIKVGGRGTHYCKICQQ